MRTSLKVRSLIPVVIAGASLLLGAAPAFAVSVPGYAGTPAHGSPSSCFELGTGGMVTNYCSGEEYFEIPMAVNSGAHTVTVATYNNGGGTFNCTLYAAQTLGSGESLIAGTSHSPAVGYSTWSVSVTVPWGGGVGGNVNGDGSMYLYCEMNNGGTIHNVNYSE
jgi:hypothetical protein